MLEWHRAAVAADQVDFGMRNAARFDRVLYRCLLVQMLFDQLALPLPGAEKKRKIAMKAESYDEVIRHRSSVSLHSHDRIGIFKRCAAWACRQSSRAERFVIAPIE